MSADKYLSIFSRQMEAIVYLFSKGFKTTERFRIAFTANGKREIRVCVFSMKKT